MRFKRSRSLGQQTNAAVHTMTSRIDGRTADVAERTARAIVIAVGLLRVPTAVVGAASLPFIVSTLVLGILADGAVAGVIVIAGLGMAVINALFWIRRGRIIAAAGHPEQLATELGIVVSMSGKVEETRGALEEIAGGGGWRILGRLRGVWHGTQMTGRWIEGVGDLERARYFAPPKIGTTVTLAITTLWLIPISVVVSLMSAIGTIAGSI